jgi:hypothetical protein
MRSSVVMIPMCSPSSPSTNASRWGFPLSCESTCEALPSAGKDGAGYSRRRMSAILPSACRRHAEKTVEIRVDRNRHDALPRRHDAADRSPGEIEELLRDALHRLAEDARAGAHGEQRRQLLLAHPRLDVRRLRPQEAEEEPARRLREVRDRPEQGVRRGQEPHGAPDEVRGPHPDEPLGHDLAEEQEQQRLGQEEDGAQPGREFALGQIRRHRRGPDHRDVRPHEGHREIGLGVPGHAFHGGGARMARPQEVPDPDAIQRHDGELARLEERGGGEERQEQRGGDHDPSLRITTKAMR